MTENTPDWLPDEYDAEASLRERLPIIGEIDRGIELHVSDHRGTVEIIGRPKHFNVNGTGAMSLDAGTGRDNSQWNWEIRVPAEGAGEPVLWKVDPEQDVEAYEGTKERWFTGLDVRIHGVDADRINEAT